VSTDADLQPVITVPAGYLLWVQVPPGRLRLRRACLGAEVVGAPQSCAAGRGDRGCVAG
jgi:hypothetical protein